MPRHHLKFLNPAGVMSRLQAGRDRVETGRIAARTVGLQDTPDAVPDLRKLLIRQVFPLGLALVLMLLLWDRVEGLDVHHIRAAMMTVGAPQWGLAALFSILSFWAVGRYDRVVHRLIGSQTRSRAAQLSGVTAIALSQSVGLGVLSSALVRWRMLPDISLFQALRISVIVAISFLSAWAVVAALVVLFVPLALPGSTWIAGAVLTGAALLGGLSIWRPRVLSRLNLPPLRAMGAFVAFAAIDTAAAGLALWAVLPESCDIGMLPLIAAYLIALGAGLISGTPGGVGPFEVTLFALLPHVSPEPLLAAILVFRIVYYAIPALIAAVATIRGPMGKPGRDTADGNANVDGVADTATVRCRDIDAAPQLPRSVATAIARAPRAETALLRQGQLSVLERRDGRATGMAKQSGQSLIVLSDPMRPEWMHPDHLDQIRACALRTYQSPFLYKIGPRMAAAARQAGWQVLPIAREAWIIPADFTTDGSCRRQLRRKLRQAGKAGVDVRIGGGNLPLDEMERIACAWRDARGGERGFSMGTWQPATLPHAEVVLASHQGRLVGFVTLHRNAAEQVLDLMRISPDAPDGTMHLLVHSALKTAATQGCPRLSLAAVPLGRQPHEPALFHDLRDRLDRISGAEGLRQFKASFAPNWETLYVASPGRLGLFWGALDVMREIARPQAPAPRR